MKPARTPPYCRRSGKFISPNEFDALGEQFEKNDSPNKKGAALRPPLSVLRLSYVT